MRARGGEREKYLFLGDDSKGMKRRQEWITGTGQHLHMFVIEEASGNVDTHIDDPSVSGWGLGSSERGSNSSPG